MKSICAVVRNRVVPWAVVAAVWAVFAGSSACFARDDFQSWSTWELSKRMGTAWEVFFLPEIRIRNDAGELFYHIRRSRW